MIWGYSLLVLAAILGIQTKRWHEDRRRRTDVEKPRTPRKVASSEPRKLDLPSWVPISVRELCTQSRHFYLTQCEESCSEYSKAELEASGKSTDKGVNQLLRSLSLYGYRQPMSRESRLTLRRKIKSLIIRYGIPAVWFTLNPNDITNPVKLRLAAYRTREPAEAEAFLTSLDQAYKRARLAISDPLSSAIFFHREVSMFFEHYVRTGEESVFGRISQYFGAVETNERGALHLHGLLWLQGNSPVMWKPIRHADPFKAE